jgi:hypothetical protein
MLFTFEKIVLMLFATFGMILVLRRDRFPSRLCKFDLAEQTISSSTVEVEPPVSSSLEPYAFRLVVTPSVNIDGLARHCPFWSSTELERFYLTSFASFVAKQEPIN